LTNRPTNPPTNHDGGASSPKAEDALVAALAARATARDRAICEALYEHRVLTATQLAQLHFRADEDVAGAGRNEDGHRRRVWQRSSGATSRFLSTSSRFRYSPISPPTSALASQERSRRASAGSPRATGPFSHRRYAAFCPLG
jgi:hypothetical protein